MRKTVATTVHGHSRLRGDARFYPRIRTNANVRNELIPMRPVQVWSDDKVGIEVQVEIESRLAENRNVLMDVVVRVAC